MKIHTGCLQDNAFKGSSITIHCMSRYIVSRADAAFYYMKFEKQLVPKCVTCVEKLFHFWGIRSDKCLSQFFFGGPCAEKAVISLVPKSRIRLFKT